MFISEEELFSLKHSYLYKDLPLSYIFFREMLRKDVFKTVIHTHYFENFYSKYGDFVIETMFPDSSFLTLNFKEKKAYVISPSRGLFKEFDITPNP